jgi:rubredoxin
MISTIQATDRFENTEFSNEVLDGMALPLTTAYTCSQCGTQIGFHKRDFETGAREHRSNLKPGVARLLDEFAREHIPDTRDFLDWVCPQCGLAARVYVRFWAGGKHGDAGVSLLSVIEGQPDTDEVRG